MTREIDLYSNNDLAPYSPGGDLAPIQPADSWGDLPVDYLSERPAPSQEQQLQQVQAEVGRVIAADLQRLNHPVAWINASLGWYAKNIGRDPGRVQRRHNFNLHDQAGDPLAEAFGNHCKQIGASQEFVSNVLWLLGEAAKRLTGGQPQTPVSTDPTDALSDADYDRVVAINTAAVANTEGYLRDLWGSSYAGNIRVVHDYWSKLSDAEQAHLGQYTTGFVVGTNTPEVLLGLFRQAIGAGSLPTGGAEISREIASIENVMKTERSKYMKDNQLQARYRHLLNLRDGGR